MEFYIHNSFMLQSERKAVESNQGLSKWKAMRRTWNGCSNHYTMTPLIIVVNLRCNIVSITNFFDKEIMIKIPMNRNCYHYSNPEQENISEIIEFKEGVNVYLRCYGTKVAFLFWCKNSFGFITGNYKVWIWVEMYAQENRERLSKRGSFLEELTDFYRL